MFIKMAYSIALCSVWLVLVCAIVVSGSIDNRRCTEKLDGPLNEFDTTSHVLHLEASATNYFTVTVSCRIVCQENGATYTPHLRIVATEDGQFYESNWHEASHLFHIDVPRSENLFACDATDNVTIYDYHVTVIDPVKVNRSIAMCGLFYVSSNDSDYSEFCYTDRVAWITVPEMPTDSTPTPSRSATPSISTVTSAHTSSSMSATAIPSTSFSAMSTSDPSSNLPSVTVTVTETVNRTIYVQPGPDVGSGIQISGEASVGVIVTIVVVSITIIGLLLLLVVILYKRGTQCHRVEPEATREVITNERGREESGTTTRAEDVFDISRSSNGSERLSRDHQCGSPDALVITNDQL